MKKLFLALFLMALSGCTSRVSHMGLIMPSSLNLKAAEINQAQVVRDVKGEDSSPAILFIALGQPSFEKAVNQALVKGNGNAIINAKVSNITQWYILFGINKVEIEGDVVNFRSN